MDTATILILRALAGKAGKVEIGRRRFTFSCTPTFRLQEEATGRVHVCVGSAGLIATLSALARSEDDTSARPQRRTGT